MNPPSEQALWRALETVIDPELEVDIANLGLVYEVARQGGDVKVTMTFTSLGCPVGPELVRQVGTALTAVEGVERVEVEVTFDPPWSTARLTEDGLEQLRLLGYSR
jgi:metal-sulfur cluster biosynthetic enzyme